MREYKRRLVDELIKSSLEAAGTVMVTGPKFVGKSTTCALLSYSEVKLSHFDPQGMANIESAKRFPREFLLSGKRPKLVDEWQLAPQLFGAAKDLSDELGEGSFLFTGSNSLSKEDQKFIDHAGNGRIVSVKMRPFSLFEDGLSSGSVSINDLLLGNLNGEEKAFFGPLGAEDYASLVVYGNWPLGIGKSEFAKAIWIKGYCEKIYESDISRIDGVSRNMDKAKAILRSLARNDSTPIKKTTVLSDVALEGEVFSMVTFDDYFQALEKMYLFDPLEPWSPALRSRGRMVARKKFEFVDPSIASYFLEATPDDLYGDPKTFGFLFENLAIRDLKIYLEAHLGSVSYMRFSSGEKEIDAIVRNRGRWGAIEIKLAPDEREIDEAAKKLLAIADDVDTEKSKKPEFLAIVTGLKTGWKRDDGVYVLPLSCLKD